MTTSFNLHSSSVASVVHLECSPSKRFNFKTTFWELLSGWVSWVNIRISTGANYYELNNWSPIEGSVWQQQHTPAPLCQMAKYASHTIM